MGYRGLVDTSTGVYVDRVDDFCAGLRILVRMVLVLVLARGGHKKAPVGGEGKPSEE